MRMLFNSHAVLKCLLASCFVLFLNSVTSAQKEQTIEHWLAMVEQNPKNAEAWFNIGVLYESGQGTRRSQTKAYESYQKAIKLNYAPAMFNLGSIYAKQKDYTNARIWWEKAAELDLPEAQYNMGMLYEKGWGVDVDPQLALSWYQRAAETAMEKYFQLYQQSRSEQSKKRVVEDASLSIVDYLAFIKTASAAPAQPEAQPANPVPVDSRLAQAETAEQAGPELESATGWDWIYSQPEEHYTIQLFATKDPEKTGKFIQQYALSERARVIEAVVKGTTYHKVLLGSFAEWNDAAVEIGTFPQDLRNQRPWVRKFGSLYNELPDTAVVMRKDQSESEQAQSTEIAETADQNVQAPSGSAAEQVAPDDEQTSDQAAVAQATQPAGPAADRPDQQSAGETTLEDNETQPAKDSQQTQADQLQSGPAEQQRPADALRTEENPVDSLELPPTDGVFSDYTNRQLESDGLSAELKAQLKSGLEAIQSQDYQRGFDELSVLADSGLPEAQYQLALLYSGGKGVQESAVKAFELIKSAAEQGHPYAQQVLADFYSEGAGVQANSSLAAYWRQTAADNLRKLENN